MSLRIKNIILFAVLMIFASNIELKSQDIQFGTVAELSTFIGEPYNKFISLAEIGPCSVEGLQSNCIWQPFVCKDISIGLCKYNLGQQNGLDLKIIVSGYYVICNGNFYIEIVDVIPQCEDDEDYDCSQELIISKTLMANMIKAAQLEVIKIMANSSKIKQAGVKFTMPTDEVVHYNMQAKTCWKSEPIAYKEPDFPGKWAYLEECPEIDFKINANESKKENYLQNIGWDDPAYRCLGRIKPCDFSACCITEYNIIWTNNDGHGNRMESMQYTGTTNSSTVICENIPLSTACKTICDDLKLPNIDSQGVAGLSCGINPNPNSGVMTLMLNTSINGQLLLNVTDVNGNIVFQKYFIKTTEQYSLDFEILGIINGNYYYNILQNDISIVQGGFTVQK